MGDFTIERTRPEDAAAMLEYLKIIGGETDNLNMGTDGILIPVEQEEAYLRSMVGSTDSAMFTAKINGEIIGVANVSRLTRRMSHRGSIGAVSYTHLNNVSKLSETEQKAFYTGLVKGIKRWEDEQKGE